LCINDRLSVHAPPPWNASVVQHRDRVATGPGMRLGTEVRSGVLLGLRAGVLRKRNIAGSRRPGADALQVSAAGGVPARVVRSATASGTPCAPAVPWPNAMRRRVAFAAESPLVCTLRVFRHAPSVDASPGRSDGDRGPARDRRGGPSGRALRLRVHRRLLAGMPPPARPKPSPAEAPPNATAVAPHNIQYGGLPALRQTQADVVGSASVTHAVCHWLCQCFPAARASQCFRQCTGRARATRRAPLFQYRAERHDAAGGDRDRRVRR